MGDEDLPKLLKGIFALASSIFVIMGILIPLVYEVKLKEPPGEAVNRGKRNVYMGIGCVLGGIAMIVSYLMLRHYNKVVKSLSA